MAKTPDLTSLTIELKARVEDLELLALGEGPLRKLTSLRTLKVRGDFRLNLFVLNSALADRNRRRDVSNGFAMEVAQLQRRYRESTRQLIMPDTLRVSEPPTEEENYLDSRKHIISSASPLAPPRQHTTTENGYSDAYFPRPLALGVSYDGYLMSSFAPSCLGW
ncbi:hypothetical protein IFR05_004849 [Cadophora sp. M221]|nr:hypothetical protein IFR05_004849 [Cadophora sp. M221]